jgi:hypothetical protein
MARAEGALARPLFSDDSHPRAAPPTAARRPRLAPAARLRGPGKYKVLEHRRRQAQIRARRLLDLIG